MSRARFELDIGLGSLTWALLELQAAIRGRSRGMMRRTLSAH